jgi:UDP-N-acetylglucosamine--N-acetylmuramyl-(pentapeptide) pyrophosphoryl-undecaprenol N-acetylglucosamine transferase
MEMDLVKRAGIPFQTIPAAGVHGVGLRFLPGNIAQLVRGVSASRRILSQFKPDVLFFTGGYVAFPMAVAGIRLQSLLYVPDVEPGLAIKSVARFADRIALTSEASRAYFNRQNRLMVSGYPVRSDLTIWTRDAARQKLGIAPDSKVILILGGSKGARSINNAVLTHLPGLLNEAELIHIAGSLDWPQVQRVCDNLTGELCGRYHAYDYLHEDMGAALAAADLAVSRAGASTLGEYPAFGLPAILVPYPFAWRYQLVNANYLAEQGAAFLVRDEQLPSQLLPLVQSLLNDPKRLGTMRQAMQKIARPAAASDLAAELVRLANRKQRRTKPG